MIVYTNQTKLFELMQSEKFVVGNPLFAKAEQPIENLSNRFLKEKKYLKNSKQSIHATNKAFIHAKYSCYKQMEIPQRWLRKCV
jgi:ribonucleotide reductase alpha subunit